MFGFRIDHEPFAPETVADIGVVAHQGAAVPFFDVGIRALAGADALDEILFMFRVGEFAFHLGHDHAVVQLRSGKDLPAAAVPAQAHHSLGAVDFDPRRALRPVGILVVRLADDRRDFSACTACRASNPS